MMGLQPAVERFATFLCALIEANCTAAAASLAVSSWATDIGAANFTAVIRAAALNVLNSR